MNAWQHALEFREAMRALSWPAGAQEPVFGEQVYIVAGTPSPEALPEAWPFLMIFVGSGRVDRENPLLQTRPFTFLVGQMQEGDTAGEQAVIGGPRKDQEIGTSRGRGVLEIAAEVERAVGRLYGADGHPIYSALTGSPQVAVIGEGYHLVTLPISVEVLCTTELEWQGPYNVERSGDTVSWEPTHQTAGFVEYVVVSGAAGSPPADPGSGTVIGTTTGTSLTDPAVGLAGSVAVFAGFSLVGGATAQAYSETEVGTWR